MPLEFITQPGLVLAIGYPGMPEMLVIAFIVLMLFGAKRLPEMGRSLGSGIREFKNSITGAAEEEEEAPKIDKSESNKTSTNADSQTEEKKESATSESTQ